MTLLENPVTAIVWFGSGFISPWIYYLVRNIRTAPTRREELLSLRGRVRVIEERLATIPLLEEVEREKLHTELERLLQHLDCMKRMEADWADYLAWFVFGEIFGCVGLAIILMIFAVVIFNREQDRGIF